MVWIWFTIMAFSILGLVLARLKAKVNRYENYYRSARLSEIEYHRS